MIAYLEGTVISKKEKSITVKTGGVGYKVFLSKKNLSIIPKIGDNINLHCFTNVKEDAIDIYGFLAEKELEFFEMLEQIRGIGPKAALEISSLGSLEEIKEKIKNKDESVFFGIPGIGKKKAMAIILELTGKIKDIPEKKDDEAEDGLVGLGFSRKEARETLEKIPSNLSPEERLKAALKILNKSV
ncbi:MAG: Holliday junction DNA helicase RuvA [Candidatus Nealsonbacteria bacterium RIFOXYB1_FULL_40_15]|uniref:Holliday junction branch migration complex subunit RuvA n=2 Tax=Candidatus Nealsoniibacteriota TaxID=1817911 RepID=A0A1G2ETT3_9BACT|nr:MAG: Holliday junction DNA helicase RuvA [Candidatus Nealsonbacteria bacterium RIFOXYB1_FULL_40_15]OGZ29153.1 MAG: Holliday junction DNA helicase RuvA [Candidatus Nealsonbacteria bacterium RIFOXYC1_FULL_40_7]